jgi:GNAT superfamily N-acetyltransferase
MSDLQARIGQDWFNPYDVLLLEVDGNLAGFCWLKVEDKGAEGRIGEVYVIGTAPEYQGRGLGLANKIRTYQLQDAGLDTVDANTVLGFDDDERDYGVAVRMLQVLGCTRVRLLTNNPAKLDGLSQAGIDVSVRVPLQGPINSDNRRYLTAKATRAGHKLDHLLGVVAEASESPRKS